MKSHLNENIKVIVVALKLRLRFHSHLGPFDELLGGCLLIVQLSFPGVEGRGLQGAAVGEGQSPGLGQGAGIDGVEVNAGVLL